jgi:hypothetical protein
MHINVIQHFRSRNPAALEVIVPSVDMLGHAAYQPRDDHVGLKDHLAASQSASNQDGQKALTDRHLSVMKNREPKWNTEAKMYQLDFHGRATLASCKNVQLTDVGGKGNDARLLVGKVGDNTFNVDFSTPFSALQAFGFSLVVFESSRGSSLMYSLAQGVGRAARPLHLRGSSRAREQTGSLSQPTGGQAVQSL